MLSDKKGGSNEKQSSGMYLVHAEFRIKFRGKTVPHMPAEVLILISSTLQ